MANNVANEPKPNSKKVCINSVLSVNNDTQTSSPKPGADGNFGIHSPPTPQTPTKIPATVLPISNNFPPQINVPSGTVDQFLPNPSRFSENFDRFKPVDPHRSKGPVLSPDGVDKLQFKTYPKQQRIPRVRRNPMTGEPIPRIRGGWGDPTLRIPWGKRLGPENDDVSESELFRPKNKIFEIGKVFAGGKWEIGPTQPTIEGEPKGPVNERREPG